MKRILLPLIATMALAGFSGAQADEAWQADFRKADLNDSGGLSKVDLDKSKVIPLRPRTKRVVKVKVMSDTRQLRDSDFEVELSPFQQGARILLRNGQRMELAGL